MPKQNLPQPQPPKHTAPPPELIEKFLSIQEQEVAIRQQELAVQQQADANHFEFAKKALDEQVADRERERSHQREKTKQVCNFSLLIILIIVFFLGFALYRGKDQIALEIIKAAGFFLSGGAGGFFLGKGKASKQEKIT